MTAISVVVVAYQSAAALERTLEAVRRQLGEGDELLVVDNGGCAHVPGVITGHGNVGFAAGCNIGAGVAKCPLLVFLNPDAMPRTGWATAMREPWEWGWTAWQARVVAGGAGDSAGNPVHFTGLTWAGEGGTALSGACLAVRAEAFRAVGGFTEPYFMYHEDVDLSLRLRLTGARLGVAEDAVVDHDYEFEKSNAKWHHLERNRWFTLLRCWPASVLAAVLPALAATELMIWATAIRGGWAGAKARATQDVIRALPWLLRERGRIERRVGAAVFATWLTPDLSSPYLGAAGRSRAVRSLLRGYWSLVCRVVSPHR